MSYIKFYSIILIVMCFSYCEMNKITIMKCCQLNKYVGFRGICNKTNASTTFDGVVIFDKGIWKTDKKVKDVFELVPASLRNFTKRRIVSPSYNYYLIEDGSLMLELPNTLNRWTRYSNEQFCIDTALTRRVNQVLEPEVRFWTVPRAAKGSPKKSGGVFLVTALSISSVFMALVLVVYCLLPELRNLCGMILMAYVASTLGAFSTLATLNFIANAKKLSTKICFALTFMDYFFFLSSFYWMNVMSVDIWWTFRGYAKARRIHRRGEIFKFGLYSLYAWGVPLAMTVGMRVVHQMDLTHIPWFVKPNLDSGCFLEGAAKMMYLYVPLLVITVMNWVLFLMTAFNIWRLGRGTAVLDSSRNSSGHRRHRQRFLVYLKLSVVMGINWVLEVTSYLWPGYHVWYITDTYNLLIGVFIFFIFVCKKKIIKKLRKRFCSEPTKWSAVSTSPSTSTSSDTDTSQDTFQICMTPSGTKHII